MFIKYTEKQEAKIKEVVKEFKKRLKKEDNIQSISCVTTNHSILETSQGFVIAKLKLTVERMPFSISSVIVSADAEEIVSPFYRERKQAIKMYKKLHSIDIV